MCACVRVCDIRSTKHGKQGDGRGQKILLVLHTKRARGSPTKFFQLAARLFLQIPGIIVLLIAVVRYFLAKAP